MTDRMCEILREMEFPTLGTSDNDVKILLEIHEYIKNEISNATEEISIEIDMDILCELEKLCIKYGWTVEEYVVFAIHWMICNPERIREWAEMNNKMP